MRNLEKEEGIYMYIILQSLPQELLLGADPAKLGWELGGPAPYHLHSDYKVANDRRRDR